MSHTPTAILACCLLLPLIACGNVTPVAGGDGAAGSGGSTAGTGGNTGTGGATGTGGSTGTGGGAGGAGSGGSGGSGGGGGTGGVVGDAGSDSNGGETGRVPRNHRVAPTACNDQRAAGACGIAMPTVPVTGACTTDGQCGAGTNGRCLSAGRVLACSCSYDTCFADSDCAGKGPCACRSKDVAPTNAANVCLKGNCQVDADCGAGGYCSPTYDFSCGRFLGIVGYYCHTPKDTCTDDADCPAPGDCRYNPAVGVWACATSQCVG